MFISKKNQSIILGILILFALASIYLSVGWLLTSALFSNISGVLRFILLILIFRYVEIGRKLVINLSRNSDGVK